LFSRKGYNIETITAGSSKVPGTTRISVVALGDDKMMEQLANQLRKLLLVISVDVLTEEDSVCRELLMVKMAAGDKDTREELIQIVNIFRGSIVDICKDSLTVAVVGTTDKNRAILNMLEDFEILEIARTGSVALERGSGNIHDKDKVGEEYRIGKTTR
jgi:acetolactate synthase-1/3 small subunit